MGKFVDALLILIPIGLWAAHIYWLVPQLEALKDGDARMNMMMQCFGVSAAAMILCEIIGIARYMATKNAWLVLAIIFNMTWLYYVKVIFYGPTVGQL
jgi:hypothetical protein